jgi:hypothetical protein
LDNATRRSARHGPVWEVIAIARDLGNIRHCRIVDVNDRSISKLISEETLTDRKFYKLVI